MPHQKPFLIAIDGPNASGKGTLARRLGKELGFPVLDTGLLYRAVGWLVLHQQGDLHDQNTALHAADELHEKITPDFLSNPELRASEIGNAASIVSAFGPVRQSLFDLQRHFALHPPHKAMGAILDGRDIGTVICPDADIKFYVTAKPELRAERRAKELYGDDWQSHFESLLLQTIERDKRDSERTTAPLKPAEDAIHIDTSDLNADQTFAFALEKITERR
jgi:CMP/dCMP kinase